MDLGTWEFENSHPGWKYTGQDSDGNALWEIIPELQTVGKTQIVNWIDPLTRPGFETGGLDAGLALYSGKSEAQREQYKIDEAGVFKAFGIARDSLADKFAERTNTQSGGYGTGASGTRISAVQPKTPLPLLILSAIVWFL